MVLTTRKLQKAFIDPVFRNTFPEWEPLFSKYDTEIKKRKQQKRCSTCGLMRPHLIKITKDITTNPAIAQKVKDYFSIDSLELYSGVVTSKGVKKIVTTRV